jgi:glycosyltransferase involved in cell wall biosynthesis
VIASYGDREWHSLALTRAYPSALDQGAHEIVVGHDDEVSIAQVRNALAEKTTGDWLCFLDADDELADGYLDAMARVGGEKVLLTPRVQKIIKGRARPLTFYPEVPLDQANWLVIGTLLRRDLFMEVGGFSDYPHGFEDWSLWAKCWKAGARVVRVPRAIYRQHVNPQSKHRLGWRDRRWQVETHNRVRQELFG